MAGPTVRTWTITLLTAALVLAAALAAAAALDGQRRAGPTPAGADAPARSGPLTAERLAALLQARVEQRPNDATALLQLGDVYLVRARETGDPSYYSRAEQALRRAHELEPDDPLAMSSLGALALARHQFAEALEWGQRAKALNPQHARTLAVVVDALIELGRYDAAFAAVEELVEFRPDLNSYARSSYAQELRGDRAGAVAAMRLAAETGLPGSEPAAWARVQLGNLLFNEGRFAAAEAEYLLALSWFPGRADALAGLARVRAAQGQYDEAISHLESAVANQPLPEYVVLLADVLRLAGRPAEAERQEALVEALDRLFRANGVDTDLELALFLVDQGKDLPGALARAEQAYARRPNVHAADVLAWARLRTGDVAGAQAMVQQALRLGTRDALLLYHAAEIARAAGQPAQAERYLAEALELNPFFSFRYAGAARELRAALQAEVGGGRPPTAAPEGRGS